MLNKPVSLLLLSLFALPLNAADPPAASGDDRATLTLYRVSGLLGGMVGHTFSIDGKRVAKLRTKSYTSVKLSAGQHQLCMKNTRLCLSLEFEPGAHRIIRASNFANANAFVSKLEEVSLDRANQDAKTDTGSEAGVTGYVFVKPEVDDL